MLSSAFSIYPSPFCHLTLSSNGIIAHLCVNVKKICLALGYSYFVRRCPPLAACEQARYALCRSMRTGLCVASLGGKLHQESKIGKSCRQLAPIFSPKYSDQIFYAVSNTNLFCEIFGLRRMWNNSLRELWNISRRLRLLTFAKQIFHSEAISLGGAKFHSPQANFVEKRPTLASWSFFWLGY